MSFRVTDAEVKELIDTNRNTVPFIDIANTVVEEYLVSVALSDKILVKIELYLSAHYTALTEEKGGLIKDSYGDSSEEYSNTYGKGFKSTRYGQQAITMDTTGTLVSLSNQKLTSLFSVV